MAHEEENAAKIRDLAKEIAYLKEMITTFSELLETKQYQMLDLIEGFTGLHPKTSRPERPVDGHHLN